VNTLTSSPSVLDPRIKYDGLKGEAEADGDNDYEEHIACAKTALTTQFVDVYTKSPIIPPTITPATKGTLPNRCQRVDFTAWYHH
jgi:hypothetical protein